jgi:hypothetical protein
MLRLKKRQRAALGATLRELANLTAGALILGQLVSQQPFSWRLVLAGAAIWVVLIMIVLGILGERR